MSRWKPNARERLAQAALDLFAERGYDSVTVAEIAERAGLTKRTFFRYFADKREVLFGGQDVMGRLFTEAITGAPASATPIDVIAAALEAVAAIFAQDRLESVRLRQAVVAEHRDLQERELLKRATLTATIADGLRERGLTGQAVSLAAELGNFAFRTTFARWVDPANKQKFAELAHDTLDELKAALAELD